MRIVSKTFCAFMLGSIVLLGCSKTSRLVSVMSVEFDNALWAEPSWGVYYKGHRILATDDGNLEVRLYSCRRWTSLEDCENNHGWEHDGGRISLAEVDPSTIKVVQAMPDALAGPNEAKPSGYRVDYACVVGERVCWTDVKIAPTLVCKGPTSCEDMAGALRELVASATPARKATP